MTSRRKARTDVQNMVWLQTELGERLLQIQDVLNVPDVKLALVVIHPTEPEASFLVTDATHAEIRKTLDKVEAYEAEVMAKGKRITA